MNVVVGHGGECEGVAVSHEEKGSSHDKKLSDNFDNL